MIKFMFDTCTCIDIMRDRCPRTINRLVSMEDEAEVAISTIVLAELTVGVYKSASPAKNATALTRFCRDIEIAQFDEPVAEIYGAVRAELERGGRMIGPLDALIAAHALSLGVPLVTSNVREFQRVPGLVVENWTA